MLPYRHLQVTTDGDEFTVHFLDRRLIGLLPAAIGEEFKDLAAQEDCRSLVLSFAGVELLSSEMLGRLIVLNKLMRAKGGHLKLCQIHPNLRRVFVVTKFHTILDIEDTEESRLMAVA